MADASGNVVQRNDHYPFGMPFNEQATDKDVQAYKFGGKEYDTMHGLDQYDFHARQYDPAISRFNTPDPLAEMYYNISSYVYCYNNPINVIDPDGKQGIGGSPLSRILGSEQTSKLAGARQMKQVGFSMFYPIAAMRIGEYKKGSNNISTVASNFEINLLKAAGISRGGAW